MPDRIIRDELLGSDRYCRLKDDADRLAFIVLLLSADDFGNCQAGPFFLARKWGDVIGGGCDEQRAGKILQELVDAELVVLYEIDNPNARAGSRFDPPKLRYLHIPRFRQRIRYPRRAYPMPPWQAEIHEPDISGYEWQKKVRPLILARDNYRCAVCGAQDSLTVDHIVPLRDGGKSRPDNLITMCRPCNMRKGTRTTDALSLQALAFSRNIVTTSPQRSDDVTVMSEEKLKLKRSDVEVDVDLNLKPLVRAADGTRTPKVVIATRLTDDWKIPEDWIAIGLAVHPDWTRAGVIRESLTFRDYWCAKSGKDATKLKWLATWRNWIRRAEREPAR